MLNIFSLINPVYNDAPEPWQIGFQDGASPAFEGITELHNSIFFYLLLISVGVAWVLGSVVVNYSQNASPIVCKSRYPNRTYLDNYSSSNSSSNCFPIIQITLFNG